MIYQKYIKRVIDFCVATTVLLLFSPLFFILWLLLLIFNRGNVFFFQERPGQNERLFKLLKFKTMRDLFDENGKPLPDKDRITPIGAFIRKTSLDELPQLMNVVLGDMSLVGPRPLLKQYLPLYDNFQKRRHEVKPGITGWAQVNGRNAISWEERFAYDVDYVDNITLTMDFKIILRTFVKVFKGSDVNASATNTMKPFQGNTNK